MFHFYGGGSVQGLSAVRRRGELQMRPRINHSFDKVLIVREMGCNCIVVCEWFVV